MIGWESRAGTTCLGNGDFATTPTQHIGNSLFHVYTCQGSHTTRRRQFCRILVEERVATHYWPSITESTSVLVFCVKLTNVTGRRPHDLDVLPYYTISISVCFPTKTWVHAPSQIFKFYQDSPSSAGFERSFDPSPRISQKSLQVMTFLHPRHHISIFDLE